MQGNITIGKLNYNNKYRKKYAQLKLSIFNFKENEDSVIDEFFTLSFRMDYSMFGYLKEIEQKTGIEFKIKTQRWRGFATYTANIYNLTSNFDEVVDKLSLIPEFEFKFKDLAKIRLILIAKQL